MRPVVGHNCVCDLLTLDDLRPIQDLSVVVNGAIDVAPLRNLPELRSLSLVNQSEPAVGANGWLPPQDK